MSGAPRLHVLGCGRAARAVTRRLLATGSLRAGLIVNRTLDSARGAVEFIGDGEAAERLDDRVSGGWLMLGLPDGLLAERSAELKASCPVAPALAFHLSGSVEAAALAPLEAPYAAVHPVRAFAEPERASAHFGGTWCVAEGDEPAMRRLRPVFEAAGARWLAFGARDKPAWHAATVAASNFLVTLQRLARDLAAQAGLSESQAAEVLCDLQQGMLDTLRERSPRAALTGPIERGDEAACRRLASAAAGLDATQAELFRTLARGTLVLARQKRGERETDEAIAALFSSTRR